MAHNGFKVVDSDMHVIEPPDLWLRYIDSGFKEIAPRGVDEEGDPRLFGMRVPGKTNFANPNWFRPLSLHMEPVEPEYQFAKEHKFDGISQLYAMDQEGIDVAILYPTRGLYVLGLDQAKVGAARASIPFLPPQSRGPITTGFTTFARPTANAWSPPR